jgi:hypothetical protein
VVVRPLPRAAASLEDDIRVALKEELDGDEIPNTPGSLKWEVRSVKVDRRDRDGVYFMATIESGVNHHQENYYGYYDIKVRRLAKG